MNWNLQTIERYNVKLHALFAIKTWKQDAVDTIRQWRLSGPCCHRQHTATSPSCRDGIPQMRWANCETVVKVCKYGELRDRCHCRSYSTMHVALLLSDHRTRTISFKPCGSGFILTWSVDISICEKIHYEQSNAQAYALFAKCTQQAHSAIRHRLHISGIVHVESITTI